MPLQDGIWYADGPGSSWEDKLSYVYGKPSPGSWTNPSPAVPAPNAAAAPGGVTGAQAPTNYSSAYGGIPQLPAPPASAAQAVTGNLANLDDILKLVASTDASNLTAATAPYMALPGYQQSLANVGRNVQQMTGGQLPSDVQNTLAQQAAERGVGQGSFRNADYLKALGLTSLGMQQQGQSALNAATAALPKPAFLNPASMFVTPQEQQQAASAQSVYNAAPVPADAAAAALAAARSGMNAGNRPATIQNPYAGGQNDTLAAISDMLKRYAPGQSAVTAASAGADPTQGFDLDSGYAESSSVRSPFGSVADAPLAGFNDLSSIFAYDPNAGYSADQFEQDLYDFGF